MAVLDSFYPFTPYFSIAPVTRSPLPLSVGLEHKSARGRFFNALKTVDDSSDRHEHVRTYCVKKTESLELSIGI